jgi:hypothetical protein
VAKFGKDIVKQIVDLIQSDEYTIMEICTITGISTQTYYRWKKEKSYFCDTIKKAEQVRDETFAVEAKKSLLKKIRGYEIEETKEVYNGNVLKEKTVTTKHVPPDTTAIIFTLVNRDSQNWVNNRSKPTNGWDNEPDNEETAVVMKLSDGTEIEI